MNADTNVTVDTLTVVLPADHARVRGKGPGQDRREENVTALDLTRETGQNYNPSIRAHAQGPDHYHSLQVKVTVNAAKGARINTAEETGVIAGVGVEAGTGGRASERNGRRRHVEMLITPIIRDFSFYSLHTSTWTEAQEEGKGVVYSTMGSIRYHQRIEVSRVYFLLR